LHIDITGPVFGMASLPTLKWPH